MASSVFVAHFLCFLLFQLHFIATCFPSFSFNSSSSTPLCHYDQSLALLQFKNSFPISKTKLLLPNSKTKISTPKTESWKEGTNCCYWDGVTCDIDTGNVIGLNLSYSLLYGTISSNNSLFFLSHLQKLDLSGNFFNQSQILPQFGQFFALTHLYLFDSDFSGPIPREISHLSNLISFDLSMNHLSLETTTFGKIFQNLTRLKALDLSDVDLSLVAPSSYPNLSSSLSSLSLMDCRLQGKVAFAHLSELLSLYLSGNDNLTFEAATFDMLVQNLTNLQELDLSDTNMSLVTPTSLMNLSSSLSSLNLRYCHLQGKVAFAHLPKLLSLDLSWNDNLTLETATFEILVQNLTKLQELDLSYTNMSLVAPTSLMNLSSSFLSLRFKSCGLTGRLPDNIFQLQNLQALDVGGNGDLTGSLPRHNWSSSLQDLSLSETQIPIYLEHDFFKNLKSLTAIELRSCHFVGSDLSLFGNLSQLTELDLSNLSNNRFNGPIPSSIFEIVKLEVLILSSNYKFTGEVSPAICKLNSLQILDLSNNSFTGSIPQCLGNMSLSILHLGKHNFNGSTSAVAFSKGCNLRYLNFNGNHLQGRVPQSILNCKNLEFLDLGNNEMDDTFPCFLGTLLELQILMLKSNKLHGSIECSNMTDSFHKVQIFDLSNNMFSGSLPTNYFVGFKAIIKSTDENFGYMRDRNYSFVYSVRLTIKGVEMEFVKVQTLFTTIDLSGNRFTRYIPQSIGMLKSLKELNMSHNKFTGKIQASLRNLANLESLDLSSNYFNGQIPTELVDLTFLEVFNVSYNQLEGPIPEGKQFNTVEVTSYEGNLGLCGSPLKKVCDNGDKQQQAPSNEDDSMYENGFGWEVVAIGYGCGVVFGLIIGYTVFQTRKPLWFVTLVEDRSKRRPKRSKRNVREANRR
ncbi:serine-threonine protein kinase, plant-type, putative [Ricinus communis]|uniref:Serine-threonine protein kinase, plant-type, putative n=1 Tax=Ricinus communis TaxID=3988 RepID=B9T8M3_RICCO|nr:serine-threonine protein kinase, plant-type, putative [Ricinus communis]